MARVMGRAISNHHCTLTRTRWFDIQQTSPFERSSPTKKNGFSGLCPLLIHAPKIEHERVGACRCSITACLAVGFLGTDDVMHRSRAAAVPSPRLISPPCGGCAPSVASPESPLRVLRLGHIRNWELQEALRMHQPGSARRGYGGCLRSFLLVSVRNLVNSPQVFRLWSRRRAPCGGWPRSSSDRT